MNKTVLCVQPIQIGMGNLIALKIICFIPSKSRFMKKKIQSTVAYWLHDKKKILPIHPDLNKLHLELCVAAGMFCWFCLCNLEHTTSTMCQSDMEHLYP